MVESQKLPEYNMDTMPLRRGHILILMIASAGQFFGGALAILVGVIAPLIAMTHHPGLSPWLQGFIFACGLIGIMLGSLFFGRFSDKYGYLFFFPALSAGHCRGFAGCLFQSFSGGIDGLFATDRFCDRRGVCFRSFVCFRDYA